MTRSLNRVRSLGELYSISDLYSSPTMFSPPSERLGHVIRFELTRGCSWRRCTFCGGYDGQKHVVKSPEEYKQHVDRVWELIGRRSQLASELERVFVGGGNALEVDWPTLHELLAYTVKMFVNNTGYEPRRLSLYGRTADILKHGTRGLKKLRHGTSFFSRKHLPGVLDLIYWGVESGSDDVLAYVNKGCTRREMAVAARSLRRASIDASVMIIPGLGGIKFYDQHVKDTAALLGVIQPRFITFMGINTGPCSAYVKRMTRETASGENRPLTPKETAVQMKEIIAKMPTFSTKVGCFDTETDSVGCNPVTFGSQRIEDRDDKGYLVRDLRYRIKDRFVEAR
jgi:hypothetical protein